MAGFRCATCGEQIDNADLGLLRASDRGTRPSRRGSFRFVHKGACDVPLRGETYSKDWDLKSLVDDPGRGAWVETSAFDGVRRGAVCFSDETLVTAIHTLDPNYPLEMLRIEIENFSCPPRRPLT